VVLPAQPQISTAERGETGEVFGHQGGDAFHHGWSHPEQQAWESAVGSYGVPGEDQEFRHQGVRCRREPWLR
jgi:hypothetical protein